MHKPCVLRNTAVSVVEDVEKLIWEWREDHLCIKKLKEYGDRNLKDKLWYEVYDLVVTNWSELPAEQKSEKMYVNFIVNIIVDHADILGRSVRTVKKKHRGFSNCK